MPVHIPLIKLALAGVAAYAAMRIAKRISQKRVCKAIAKKGWVVYTREGCRHCDDLKKDLGGLKGMTFYAYDANGKFSSADSVTYVVNGKIHHVTSPGTTPTVFPYWENRKTGKNIKGYSRGETIKELLA